MGIGMILTDNVKIDIGEKREELFKKLDNEEIRYSIIYDDINSENDKETIISISEFNLEIHLFNDMLYSIKSYNNEYTNILDVGEDYGSPASFISLVTNKITKLADMDNANLKVQIEKMDLNSMNCIFLVTCGNKKCKAILTKDAHGNVYINTLRDIY